LWSPLLKGRGDFLSYAASAFRFLMWGFLLGSGTIYFLGGSGGAVFQQPDFPLLKGGGDF